MPDIVEGFSRASRFYDNTMLGTYKECPRRYYLRHRLGWRGQGTAMPLSFGLSWHAGMDIVWQFVHKLDKSTLRETAFAAFMETWIEQGLPEELNIEQLDWWAPRVPSTAHEMYHHYIESRWPVLMQARLLASEQPFAVPLPNTQGVWYVGRLDKVIDYQAQVLALEHKSTTEYKKDGGFKIDYIEGWFNDSQIKGYEFGGSLFFPGLAGVWVDAALVHKTVHDKFRFVPVAHQQILLEEWLLNTVEWVNRIEVDKHWPKNEGACYGKFGRCQFLDICRTRATPEEGEAPPEGFIKEFWEPFDILQLQKLVDNEQPK